MAKFILVSPTKAKVKAKAAQVSLCYEQREEQTHKYESRNPFSYLEWIKAWKCGWLKQHGLGYWSFPSPPAHYRRVYETSTNKYFVQQRETAKKLQKKFIRELRKK